MSIKNILNNKWLHLLLLFVTIWVYYHKSLEGEWAIDDVIVFSNNSYVLKGWYGIEEIFTRPTFEGHDIYMERGKQDAQGDLPGGRYRPFSLMFFIMEREIFGVDPWMGHFMNLIYYMLTISVVYFFLKNIVFKSLPAYVSFFASFLFVIHPIHSEVIGNIKSRDEILALLLNVSTIMLVYYAIQRKNFLYVLAACITYFCSLLSKENGVPFIAIIPLTIWYFTELPLRKYFQFMIPLLVVFGGYLLLRFSIMGSGFSKSSALFNDPFLYATFQERYATGMQVLLYNLSQLVYPYKFNWAYHYKMWPYVTFSDFKALSSLILHLGMLFSGLWAIYKKVFFPGWCFIWYIFTFSIACNLFINIGSYTGERFLFTPSLGFCILLAWSIYFIYSKLEQDKFKMGFIASFLLLMIPVIAFSFKKTTTRVEDWKSVKRLMLVDSKNNPDDFKLQLGLFNILLTDAEMNMFENKGAYTPIQAKIIDKAAMIVERLDSAEPRFLDSKYALMAIKGIEKNSIDSFINFTAFMGPYHTDQLQSVSRYYSTKGDFQKDLETKKQFYKNSYILDPTNINNLSKLAMTFMHLSQFDTAYALSTSILEQNQNLEDIRRLRGVAYEKLREVYLKDSLEYKKKYLLK